ncbi:hypothetical protein [Pyrobaculum sp.]|uniref:hypothetical protein n=1 Tax=Pyrobaculum sp. TaxID=2004705 RepID=UPI003D0A7349
MRPTPIGYSDNLKKRYFSVGLLSKPIFLRAIDFPYHFNTALYTSVELGDASVSTTHQYLSVDTVMRLRHREYRSVAASTDTDVYEGQAELTLYRRYFAEIGPEEKFETEHVTLRLIVSKVLVL